MVTKQSSKKHWGTMLLLSLPVLLMLALIVLRRGASYESHDEQYNDRVALLTLSQHILKNPLVDNIQDFWPEGGHYVLVTYERSTGRINLEIQAGLPDGEYHYENVNDFDIHRWAISGATMDGIKKWRTQHFTYPQQ